MPDVRRNSWVVLRKIVWAIVLLIFSSAGFAANSDPLAKIPAEQRQALKNRLDDCVKLQPSQDWTKLYDLVSDTGRGGVNHEKVVFAMNEEHRSDFLQERELICDFYYAHRIQFVKLM